MFDEDKLERIIVNSSPLSNSIGTNLFLFYKVHVKWDDLLALIVHVIN